MVSPGTRLVENHESHSRTIEFQYKTKWVLGSFVTTQLIWSQTPKLCTTVYWSKINFFYCKAQKRVKEISIVYKQQKEQPQKLTQTGYSTKTSSDRLMVLCIHGMHTTKYCASWGFLCFRTQYAELTKSLRGANSFQGLFKTKLSLISLYLGYH